MKTMKKTYKHIFIDGIMHMGDMIMTASVMPVLRKHCPDAHITYLCSANLAFVASMLEEIDEVIPYSYRSKGGYMDVYHLGKKLRKRHFDLGISLDPRERVTLMKWFAHIPERISLEQALGWKLGWERLFYTQDLALPTGWSYQEHSMAASFQRLMRDFFHDEETVFEPVRLKPVPAEDRKWVEQLLEREKPQGKKIALCIQTTSRTKDWPAERFREICDWLVETYDATLFLTGIPSHADRGKAILQGMKHRDKVVDLIGVTTFTQLVGLLEQVDLLLTLDTGTAHLGAAAGCPVVTIFTFNSPVIYHPPGKYCEGVSGYLSCSGKHICIGPGRCPKNDCVIAVTIPMVQTAIQKIFQEIP